MNREIKFRGWDVSANIMLPPQDLHLIRDNWDWIGIKPAIMMQCTGLRDGSGKKIYEGDILQAAGAKYHRVVFNAVEGKWEIEDGDGIRTADCRIIGNIFENPEIFGEEDEAMAEAEAVTEVEQPIQ